MAVSSRPIAIRLAGFGLALCSTAAVCSPFEQPSPLDRAWQEKAKSFLQRAVEIPSVAGRGETARVAELVAEHIRAAGFSDSDIQIIPYDAWPGDSTAALLFRWRSERPTQKPMLILGHLDVVEAKREDWKDDPFKFREQDGYFYGRGTLDMKGGVVGIVLGLAKLRQAGFRPSRDIIVFLTGDEETAQQGAIRGSTEWRNLLDAEFALNGDGGGPRYNEALRPLGAPMGSAEKTFQSYFLTVRNRGGHSSKPRRDNAIYELATALKKLEAHRFEPIQNPTTRAYFEERQRYETGGLGEAMRRWLRNPNDGEAADLIEENEIETGTTRTRCVATMLKAGHADNALAQSAEATVNCRIMPGVEPKMIEEELQRVVGPQVEIRPDPNFIGRPTPVLPLRADVTRAYAKAVQRLHGPEMRVIPQMQTGTSDASFFRAAGIPVYSVDGVWTIDPVDQRAHGLDERIPMKGLYDNVLHWETMVRELAG